LDAERTAFALREQHDSLINELDRLRQIIIAKDEALAKANEATKEAKAEVESLTFRMGLFKQFVHLPEVQDNVTRILQGKRQERQPTKKRP
jgi:hypothetical protein